MEYPGNVWVTTPPTREPLSLEEAKAHLRVEHDADNAWISQEIKAARMWAETLGDRTTITSTLTYNLDSWPDDEIVYLPRPPLQAILSIVYIAPDGSQESLDVSNEIQVDTISKPGRILPAYGMTWPTVRDSLHPISIQYQAGYGTSPSSVDPYLLTAIRLRLADLYENRESVVVGTISSDIPTVAAINILRAHRTSWGF
ncbi:MAG: hypothetical protein AMS19_02680 [Gemmatimonas sp. SG8_23]|nr:MAG: hypothetical protein AMS19_02680 [Gemmatimonas sp. SG8_23]